MTDNEIIKALECCANGKCFECGFFDEASEEEPCQDVATRNALDLINRQKAEIEGLETEIDKQYEQAKSDILGNMADGGTSCHWCIEEHRNRAVKEFAERLKERKYLDTNGWSHGEHPYVVEVDDIDDVLEEMVGAE